MLEELFLKPGFHFSNASASANPTMNRENVLDAGISTGTRITIFFFFPCACGYTCVCAVASENETPFRHNTSWQGCLPHVVMFGQWKHWIQITSRLNSSERSDDFACGCVCVEFRFHLGHLHCLRLRLYFSLCLRRSWKPCRLYFLKTNGHNGNH